MARLKTLVLGIFIGMGAMAAMAVGSAVSLGQAAPTTVTKGEYDRWLSGQQTSLPSNWGRWGKDDQVGTLNLITPSKRQQAAALVKQGVSVSLARDAETEKASDNPNPPYVHKMTGVGQDKLEINVHGTMNTHFDGLAHHFDFGGAGYNGYTPDEASVLKGGHPRNAILNVKNGVFTRGFLMDIPRLKGLPYLEPGTLITVKDLEDWEKQAKIKVGSGDAMFVRTGRWARRAAKGPFTVNPELRAGLDASVIVWLRQRDLALMGSDVPQSGGPAPINRGAHDFPMVALGMHLFDNCDLEALSEYAARIQRWDFLLTAAPLPIPGATGSPINPIATF